MRRVPTAAAAAALAALYAVPAAAVTARWSFEAAYDNVAEGAWYRDSNNETATLAWGESYVMMSLAAMFRATNDPAYLGRLAWHADGVLAERDDVRGVEDYRGVSGACWRNTHYQPGGEPYCYAVHSGMIGFPLAELARLVGVSGLGAEVAYDGATFADKAARYTAAAAETVAVHEDEWRDGGYYVFRPDATFLEFAGQDQPLNQSNAMGLLLFALYDVTSEAAYLDKATRLATRFRDQLSTSAAGGYVWNYWGGPYSAPGEDVSHAAINVALAVAAAEHGVVFDDSDLAKFATTFLADVYVTDRSFSDAVGGGGRDGESYRPQVGRWLALARVRTGIYTAVRDLYDRDYGPESVGSGSLLLSWAYLAEYEPEHCEPFFYYVDWEDQGDWREATAYGSNILTTPPDLGGRCMVPLGVDAPRLTSVQQWDGAAYHTVAVWEATGGETSRFVPYDSRWPFIYWNEGVLFQFDDTWVAGQGIRVRESPGLVRPEITSVPPTEGMAGVPLDYTAAGAGDAPFWWSLARFPTGARIDAASGQLDFTPPEPGVYSFVVVLENDAGRAEQVFDVRVPGPEDAGPAPGSDAGADLDAGTELDGGRVDDAASGGCGCRSTPARSGGLAFFLVGLAALARRQWFSSSGGRRQGLDSPACRRIEPR